MRMRQSRNESPDLKGRGDDGVEPVRQDEPDCQGEKLSEAVNAGDRESTQWGSDEILRLISENTIDSFWIVDKDWNPVWITPSVEDASGFTFEEIKTKSLEQRLTPRSLEQVLKVIAEELTPERLADPRVEISRSVELEYVGKDGSTYWEEVTISLIRDSDGKPAGFIGVGRNIDERKAAEDALRESEERLRIHFEKSYDVIYSHDLDFNLLSVSPAVEGFLGYRPEELVGRSFIELNIIAPESLEASITNTLKAQSGKRMSPAQYVFIAKDGTRKHGEITASRLVKNGEVVGLVGILRDITERKEAEDALRESKRRYELIVGWMSDLVWTTDINLRTEFTSPSVERLLGYSLEDFKQLSITDYLTEESLEMAWTLIASELERDAQGADPDRSIVLEVDYVHKDGSIVKMEVNTNFVRDEDGKPVGMVGVSRDITERKKAQKALRQSEEGFRKIFEESPLGMAMIGLDFRFQRANRALCEMLGYSMQELSQLTFPDITNLEDIENLVDLAVSMRSGQISSLSDEGRFNRRDGGVIWMSVTASLMRDENGDPAYAIAMCEDITSRKQMELERSRLNEELEWRVRERTSQLDAANKELEAFCYSVSHDLSTPLRAIDGFSRMVLDESSSTLDAEARRRLETILQNTDQMNKLINGVLDFSRLGRREVRASEIDMRKLAGEVFDEFAASLTERHIDFRLGALPPASGDRLLIHLVLANLISNAIKFTAREEEPVIEVGGEAEEGKNIYWVKDNGVGFDMHYADQLFVVFGRLHSTEDFEGIGMGLANVQRIVNKHGGRVWAEGRVGEGATFYFTLPALPSESA